MAKLRSSRPFWFVLGLAAAAILLPATVVAASSLVKIAGSSGTVANVDGDHQLLVAETDPKSFFITGYPATNQNVCVQLVKPPSGKAAIVTQVRFVRQDTNLDASHGWAAYNNSTCSGALILNESDQTNLTPFTETFDPGLPISAGQSFSVEGFGSGFHGEVEASGYWIPASAAP